MQEENIVFSLPFSPYPNDSYEEMVRRVHAMAPTIPAAVPCAPVATPLSSKPDNAPMEGKLTSILHSYNVEPARNPQEIRNFVLNNLLILAVDAKAEATKTKCLEMLGKVKDVALFEERTVVTHENMTTEQLQGELRKFVSRLRGDITTIPEKEIKEIK